MLESKCEILNTGAVAFYFKLNTMTTNGRYNRSKKIPKNIDTNFFIVVLYIVKFSLNQQSDGI